jgi:hypothetical protein
MPTCLFPPLDSRGDIAFSVRVVGVPDTCTKDEFNSAVRKWWSHVHSAYLPPEKPFGFVNFSHWRGFIEALSCSRDVSRRAAHTVALPPDLLRACRARAASVVLAVCTPNSCHPSVDHVPPTCSTHTRTHTRARTDTQTHTDTDTQTHRHAV